MSRRAARITCNEADRQILEVRAASRTEARQTVERARMILGCVAGEPVRVIAERCHTRPNTVIKWRQRFAEHGLKGWRMRRARAPSRSTTSAARDPSRVRPSDIQISKRQMTSDAIVRASCRGTGRLEKKGFWVGARRWMFHVFRAYTRLAFRNRGCVRGDVCSYFRGARFDRRKAATAVYRFVCFHAANSRPETILIQRPALTGFGVADLSGIRYFEIDALAWKATGPRQRSRRIARSPA